MPVQEGQSSASPTMGPYLLSGCGGSSCLQAKARTCCALISRTVQRARGLHPSGGFRVVPGWEWDVRREFFFHFSPSCVLMSPGFCVYDHHGCLRGMRRWCCPAWRMKKQLGSRRDIGLSLKPCLFGENGQVGTGETSHKMQLFDFIDLVRIRCSQAAAGCVAPTKATDRGFMFVNTKNSPSFKIFSQFSCVNLERPEGFDCIY